MGTVRPAPSVTLAARAGNGTSEAERPATRVRRSSRMNFMLQCEGQERNNLYRNQIYEKSRPHEGAQFLLAPAISNDWPIETSDETGREKTTSARPTEITI
jgi:hypothetical protein